MIRTNRRRKKKCKICGEWFIPTRDFQPVCPAHEYEYAIQQLEKKRNKEKAELKRKEIDSKRSERKSMQLRKESLKTIPTLTREAQAAFNSFIKERDYGKPCISCGRPFIESPYLKGQMIDAGHYRSVGSSPENRFNEDNCHGQCVHCNRNLSGNAVEYRIGLIERIGIARVEAIEANNKPLKLTREQLIDIKKRYSAKARELKEKRLSRSQMD